jgi:hypothetical protein
VKVYIAGPMSGLPEHNFPAFHQAAERWRAAGYEVVNPAEHDAECGTEMPWDFYLRRDLKLLTDCAGIVLLVGWWSSRGAILENHVARALGLTVFHNWHVIPPL